MSKAIEIHPKDIIVGKARVCWDEYLGYWMLPGGRKTMSRDIAESVCSVMNDLMMGRA